MRPAVPRAAVVVLGDLGRSPRMLRHAQSLSRMGFEVDLVGFRSEEMPREPRIRVRAVPSFERIRGRTAATFGVAACLRQLALGMALFVRLISLHRPRIVLVQNPPAFPTLPLVLLFARLWRAPLIVDWHNFTGAMLRLRPVPLPIARLAERAETALARHATAHLAASQAMADRLRGEWNVRATAVPDRATAAFAPRDRVAAATPTVIAPTSWGADEDFALLAEAARQCETMGLLLQILVTGKGEHRHRYEKRFASMGLQRVAIRTAWFAAEEYPRALASADLGLCLHRSASGVDLPAKVPEMLASGLPVCAFDCGPALREQLREGEDGLFFSTASELAAILRGLCAKWPDAPELDRLRASVRACERPRWDEEWDRRARPVIENALA